MKKLLSEEKEAEMMICEKCKTPINVLNGHKFCACINTPTVPPKVEENKNEGEEERCPKCGYMIAKCSDLTIRCGCPVPSSATEKSCEKCGFNHSIKDCPKYNNTASKWTFSDKGGKLLYCEYFTPRQPVNKNEGEELEKIKEVFAKQLSISQLENGMGVYQILPNGKATLNDELLKEILAWHSAIVADLNRQHEDKLNRVIDEAVHAVEELYREHKYQGKSIGKVRDEAIAKIQALKENGK